jgi:hypothetical protein
MIKYMETNSYSLGTVFQSLKFNTVVTKASLHDGSLTVTLRTHRLMFSLSINRVIQRHLELSYP